MTVQELREEIVQKTEEINGYLESRDADKAEEALAEKRKLQKLLAVREAEDEYLRVGYDDDNDYITELIDISEAYIDGCVGTAYREKDKYNSEEEYKRGCRLATLLQKKVISDMYDVRGTTVSNNTKQDKITQTILDKLANVG